MGSVVEPNPLARVGDTKALDAAPKRLAWLWAFALVVLPGGVSVGLILALHSILPALLAVPLAVAFGWLCVKAGGDLGRVLTIAIAIPLVALIALLEELDAVLTVPVPVTVAQV